MKNNIKMMDPRRAKITLMVIIIVTVAAIIAALTLPCYLGKIKLRKEHPYLDIKTRPEISRDEDTFYATIEKKDGKWYLPCQSGTSWLERAEQEGNKDSELSQVAEQYRKMLPGIRKDAVRAYAEEYFCGTRYEKEEKAAVATQMYQVLLY